MRCRAAVFCLLVMSACSTSKVDPQLVGTWEVNVPNADGVARWVWGIRADGTYDFHAEGPGNVPSHSGTFQARSGKYSLRSTTISWTDDGTYVVQGNTLNATGKLGNGVWTRVPQAAAPPAATPPPAQPVGATPGGGSAIYSGAAIYEFLSHHRFDDGLLEPPLKVTHDFTVDLTEIEKGEGVIGIVRVDAQGAGSAGTISFVVFRDRAAAEGAHDVEAVYDSKSFRTQPGEFVGSHSYDHHERGIAQCLSRHVIDTPTATVTCYLLALYPTREPVMLESQVSETVAPKAEEASSAAVARADDLLFAGIKEWALIYSAIGR